MSIYFHYEQHWWLILPRSPKWRNGHWWIIATTRHRFLWLWCWHHLNSVGWFTPFSDMYQKLIIALFAHFLDKSMLHWTSLNLFQFFPQSMSLGWSSIKVQLLCIWWGWILNLLRLIRHFLRSSFQLPAISGETSTLKGPGNTWCLRWCS